MNLWESFKEYAEAMHDLERAVFLYWTTFNRKYFHGNTEERKIEVGKDLEIARTL